MLQGKISLLIAEPDERERKKYVEAFGKEKEFDICCCTGNGKTAIEQIRIRKPDVVIMDAVLPNVGGTSVLEQIINENLLSKEQCLVITTAVRGGILYEYAFHALSEFEQSYLMMKPFAMEEMKRRIRHMVSKGEQTEAVLHSTRVLPFSYTKAKEIYLENEISRMLREFGIPVHIKGYRYLRDGIILSMEDENMLSYITKFLYPALAKKYNTSASCVERAIRHAIEVAWSRGNKTVLEGVLGYSHVMLDKRPTNSEFIGMIVENLKLKIQKFSLVPGAVSL